MLTLLSQVSPEGLLPHIVSHEKDSLRLATRAARWHWPQPDRSPFVQPPVVALAAREIWLRSGDKGFLHEALPPLERHFQWLWEKRRYGGSSLVSIISPWESGQDHKPAFDRLMGRLAGAPLWLYIALFLLDKRAGSRGYDLPGIAASGLFNVREVLFNTVYALGLEALSVMFYGAGDSSRGELYAGRGRSVEEAILDECYDSASGYYFDVDCRNGALLIEPGISSLMPLALGSIPAQRREELVKHLRNTDEFWLDFPVPSLPRSSRYFSPESRTYLWRGPTWINTNWLIVEGLRRHGYIELADEIAAGSRALVEKSGFCEYYNPLTGKGGGERGFSWSTMAAVM